MARKHTQRGSALVYILIAIALLAALTATFMNNSSQQTSSQNTFNTVTELNSQINFIRSAIEECVMTYPEGDQTPGYAALLSSFNVPYPIYPNNAYFTGATPGPTAAGTSFVSDLRCPGNPGDSNDHELIFGGNSGKFLPPPPKLFNPWSYYNEADGIFIVTGTTKTDAFLTTALQKLDDQFSECEADVMTGPFSMVTDDAFFVCPASATCLRVWLKTSSTAVYQGADELAACP
jgi:type II secretory pathway pseudopilin PulG